MCSTCSDRMYLDEIIAAGIPEVPRLPTGAEPFPLESSLEWQQQAAVVEYSLRAGLRAAAIGSDLARHLMQRLVEFDELREHDRQWMFGYIHGRTDSARSFLSRFALVGPGPGRCESYMAGWAAGVRDTASRAEALGDLIHARQLRDLIIEVAS